MSAGALDGLLAADFGRTLAGPYATMPMADLGADVVKVERPGMGDPIRLGATPPAHRLAPPRLGEDDARVRGILGR